MQKVRVRSRKILSFVLIGLGIAGLVTSLVIWRSQPKALQYVKNVSVQAAPSSVKPTTQAVATYTVPPTLPKYIAIPAINLAKARIIQLGLLPNGAIATPTNIYDTGWYNGSSKPGQPGAMFIYGHVSSWQANGVFYNLKKLQPGDTIIVTRGDNQSYTYKVTATKIYPYNQVDMNEVLATTKGFTSGLNLMTCTGKVIKGTNDFDERLVVFAGLVSS